MAEELKETLKKSYRIRNIFLLIYWILILSNLISLLYLGNPRPYHYMMSGILLGFGFAQTIYSIIFNKWDKQFLLSSELTDKALKGWKESNLQRSELLQIIEKKPRRRKK